MNKSKKVFLIVALVFFAIMVYIGYDISSRTTFPGSKPQLKERLINQQTEEKDSTAINVDSLKY
ncbi:hypothetical protein LVD15_21925 [Fulvivirga maritima]|uniref:hypothetical protein n=1 Tax=Fulvivirga maritima TaxID=2904247 RepID=UPI001F412D98|nr:hypothetical protein [Fulvivirga maritima]UII25932.1 hypothetical protein LVD15_21925 [Fulvivirga maritima]